MGSSYKWAAANGQANWPLLRRLKCFFQSPVSALPALPMPAAVVAPEARLLNLSVLVVDDNPVNRMVASGMLSSLGVQPLLAADGAEAVALAVEMHLDLILMDLQMPVLDGLGATQQIRCAELEQARARTPVVAYTSVAGKGLNLQGLGFDDVLDKPCEMQALQQCLARWCPALELNAAGGPAGVLKPH